jgi:3-hydroxybutyryl-CoA dehydratase
VLVGDTITATYTIAEIDEETLKTYADIEIVNQRGELCTVARHVLKFIV